MSHKERGDLEARHQRYDDGLVFERFHRGQLPEVERQDFEEHFLTCDHCLDRLESVERLQGAMQGVAVEEATRLDQQAQVVQAVAAVVWWRRWALWRQVGSALLVTVLSVGLWRLDVDRDALRGQLEQATAPPSRTFLVPLDTVRSAGDDAARRLDLTTESEWIVFTLQAPQVTERYQVGLETEDGREVWWQGGVEADGSGQLLVGLPSAILQEARYIVWLEPEGHSEQRHVFPLVVERRENP